MSLRYLITGGLAVVVTFLLFFEMQALITMRGGGAEKVKSGRLIEFVRLRKESELRLKERKLPRKEAPEKAPPPLPDMSISRRARPDQQVGNVAPALDLSLDMAGGLVLGAAPRDTDIIPMVRVNPQYPIQALERGIEGWVEVRFTITAAGTVKDPVVLASKPSSIFNRAALRAIRKWKYKPKIEEGVAVERPGVVVRLTFELEAE